MRQPPEWKRRRPKIRYDHMRVLFLGPPPEISPPSQIPEWLRRVGCQVRYLSRRVTPADIGFEQVVVSHRYRHILGPSVIEGFWADGVRPVNLHPSLLPYNRGADPNFWSWWDKTPKGITIHEMDEGVDTGPVIAQRTVTFGNLPITQLTLANTWEMLHDDLFRLFRKEWRKIAHQEYHVSPQAVPDPCVAPCRTHTVAERAKLGYEPRVGWDTPVLEVEYEGQRRREESGARRESGR